MRLGELQNQHNLGTVPNSLSKNTQKKERYVNV